MHRLTRHIPNCITLLRIIGSVILLFLRPLGSAFLTVYTFCGLTDALDGVTARLLKVTSAQGAILDSISDLIFYCVMLICLLPLVWSALHFSTLLMIGIAAGLRIVVYLTAYCKYRVFPSLHTYGNKFTGFCVFLFPYVAFFFPSYVNGFSLVVAVIGALVSLEELLIHLTSPTYSPWRKTVFSTKERAS